jgi:hypothetical protein
VVDGPVVSALTVEFCGLPGAGKSHLVVEVRRALGELGVAATVVTSGLATPTPRSARAMTRGRLAARQLGRDPTHARDVASSVLHGGQRRPGDGPRQVLQWLAVQELLQRSASATGVHLLDEGPLQVLWSVGLWGESEPLLQCLEGSPARWRRADVLVVVQVSPEAACTRLAGRVTPHSRVEILTDPAERLQVLRRGRQRLDDLVRLWERLDSPVLTVHAGRTGAARRLARDLWEHGAAAPPLLRSPIPAPSVSDRQEPP